MIGKSDSTLRTGPTLDEWPGLLAPNTLQVLLGVDEVGEPCHTTLGEAAPLNIQGTNVLDRDRVILTLLAQLYARNDSNALRVMLLDPRQRFTPLFRLYDRTGLVATSPPGLIQAMDLMQRDLTRRMALRAARTPPWLIYVELGPGLYQDALAWQALRALVAHGAGVGLYLLVSSACHFPWHAEEEALPPCRRRLSITPDGYLQLSAVLPPGSTEQEASARLLLLPSLGTRLLDDLAHRGRFPSACSLLTGAVAPSQKPRAANVSPLPFGERNYL